MTKAAEIRALAQRIVACAEAMAEPRADVQAEAKSIDRYLVRIKALTTDATVTVCHRRPQLIHRYPDKHFGEPEAVELMK